MAEEIQAPLLNYLIVSDGVASTQFHTWMEQITEAVKPPLTGSGTPEAAVIASIGRWYVNTAAGAGTGIFFKETGEGDTGWVARS